jgi:hypothetical protein
MFLLSGFNPFDMDSIRLDKYYKNASSPRKRNWTKKDTRFALDWYDKKYGDTPYIISCHSDGGTIAYQIAYSDKRCLGLHCHAALFTKEKKIRDIPVLLTACWFDFTGMGLSTRLAYNYYKDKVSNISVNIIRSNPFSHSYEPSIPILSDWCKQNFGFSPLTK